MSAVAVDPHHGDIGLELWRHSYRPVMSWMMRRFPNGDEQELHDSVADAWGEICARGTHTAPTPQARATWQALARLRQLDRIRARRYRTEHGLGSVALSDELAEMMGSDDGDLQSIEEQQETSASLHEVVAYLDQHLSPLERQYLQLRWQGNLGRQEIAEQLGVSVAAVGRLVTSTAKCVRRFYALRESRELCTSAQELIETLVAAEQPGVTSHPALRAHLGSCPRCQQLAVGIPRELRGAAPLIGTSTIGTIASTVAAGVTITQGAGGLLAGLGAAKVAIAGALLATAATGAFVLSEPDPGPQSTGQSPKVVAREQVVLPLSTSIGSVPDPQPAPKTTPQPSTSAHHAPARRTTRRKAQSTQRQASAAPRAATAADTDALTGMGAPPAEASASQPSRSSPQASSASDHEPDHGASAGDAEQAFGLGDSP